MNGPLLLLSNFLKNPLEVGAVAPSSKFLTREIIESIDFKQSRKIVELGPGSGVFTKEILNNASYDTKLFCFEVNKKFCSYLTKKIKDDRIRIINAGAESISANLKSRRLQEVGCIVSGLPFGNFSGSKKRKILREVRNSLSKGGRFVLFQYTNGLKDLLESYFEIVERKFVPLNVPPAFVYVCRK